MKAIKLYFTNPSYNYVTSVSEQSTNGSVHDYFVGTSFNLAPYQEPEIEDFQTCIGFAWIVKVDKAMNDRLKSVEVFNTRSNCRPSAIYDPLISSVVSCSIDSNMPYYPCCGAQEVIDSGIPFDGCVFVIDCELLAFPVWHCRDDCYRLGVLNDKRECLDNLSSWLIT